MFSAIDQSGKMPSVWRSPATSAVDAATSMPERRRDRGAEDVEQEVRLAMAGKAGKADDLAGMGDELGAVGLLRRAGADHDRAIVPRGRRRGSSAAAFSAFRAHRGDQLVAVEGGGLVGGDHLAVAHDDDAVGVVENLAEEMRDQDAARAGRHGAAHESEKLPGGVGVERGGRLVEDDEVERVVGHGEGARDLHHLAPPDRQVRDDCVRRDAVAGKNLVELGARSCRRRAGASASLDQSDA